MTTLFDVYLMAGRNVRKALRTPQFILVEVLIQPVIFVLLFAFVFGGAIHVPGVSYIDFLLPGVLVQTATFGGLNTAIALTEDLRNGLMDRFWSLPMSRFSVVAGRIVADTLFSAAGVGVMVAVGMLIGFRFHGTLPQALGAIALAILLTMGRPLLFRQARMGRDGHVFDMLKFRTMWGAPDSQGENDAEWREEMLAAQANGNGNGAMAHANGHNGKGNGNGAPPAVDRRTPLGRFLRRYSLDEFPQLLNVLRGDMALVGPRPERVAYADEFQDAVYRYRDRARIKPGLTGWAQVHGLRGETSLADRVEWDNFYIENWSPWLDLKILLLTVLAIFRTPTE